jgi:hypothetical protein
VVDDKVTGGLMWMMIRSLVDCCESSGSIESKFID